MEPHYFKCSFCMTFNQDRTFISVHEKQCNYNPINKQCGSCANRFLDSSKTGVLEYKCKAGNKCKVFAQDKLCKKYIQADVDELRLRAHENEYVPRKSL